MLTDKKITRNTTDRRIYYAPSENGRTCPFLKLDTAGNPEIEGEIAEPYTVRQTPRCICTEAAPVCSYHLGDYNHHITYQLNASGYPEIKTVTREEPVLNADGTHAVDENGNLMYTTYQDPVLDEYGNYTHIILSEYKSFFCHRYLPWKEEGDDRVVDTHSRVMEGKGRKLGWY